MHNQWQIAGNKNRDEKDSDNEDKVMAATVDIDGEKKTSTPIQIRTSHAITVRKRAILKRNAGRNIQS